EPVHRTGAERAVAESGGAVIDLPDEGILEAWRELAELEGVFCEPSSAAALAAAAHAELEPGTRVVCVITGHGLKDPETVAERTPSPVEVEPDPKSIAAALR